MKLLWLLLLGACAPAVVERHLELADFFRDGRMVSYAGSGVLVATIVECDVEIREARNGRIVTTLHSPGRCAGDIAFDGGGERFFFGRDYASWTLSDWKPIAEPSLSERPVRAVLGCPGLAAHPERALFACVLERAVVVHKSSGESIGNRAETVRDGTVALGGDYLLTQASDDALAVYRLPAIERVGRVPWKHAGLLRGLAARGSMAVVLTSYNEVGIVSTHWLPSGLRRNSRVLPGGAIALSVDKAGMVAAIAYEDGRRRAADGSWVPVGGIAVVALPSTRLLRTISLDPVPRSLAISPDGDRIAYLIDRDIHMLDTKTGTSLW